MVRSEFLAWKEGVAVSDGGDSFFRAHQRQWQQVIWGSWNDSAGKKTYILSADVQIGPQCDQRCLFYELMNTNPNCPLSKTSF